MKVFGNRLIPIKLAALLIVIVNSAYGYEIEWNGFGSTYYGQATSSSYRPSGFSDNYVNFTSFSLLGLNIAGKISEDMTFAGQLVALGNPVGTSDSYSLIAQWAYATYLPTPNVSFKMGRQLYPVLLASEYVRVAYLLPYRQIPSATLLVSPYSRFDGVSVKYQQNSDIGIFAAEVFGGTPILDVNTTVLSQLQISSTLDDLIGAQLTLEGTGWRVHAMASSSVVGVSSTAIPEAFSSVSGHSHTYSLGYRYDKNRFVSWGEYVTSSAPDGTALDGGGHFLDGGFGNYIMVGYRFGKFMPRYTHAYGSVSFNFPYRKGIYGANGEVTSHVIGFNYEVSSQAVIKVEYKHDSSSAPPGPNGYYATGPANGTATSGGAFLAGLDFIF